MSQQCTDILIHIDESLSDDDIHDLERDLSHLDGVYSACVNERARHLMLVDYDPECADTGMLLDAVESHGVHAELIGL